MAESATQSSVYWSVRSATLATLRYAIDRRRVDPVLTGLLAAAAIVLGCQPLIDSDVWWHLRSGAWILEHRRVPTLDPFTFASADRLWVDLHWLFQVMLALVYRMGGVTAIILLTAALSGLTVLVVRTARGRDCPTWISGAVWLPAVFLMAFRASPRPEVVSVLFLAVYLAILCRCERRPALVWVLPPLQVLWVNVHGLFVLGPVLLAAWVADGAFRAVVGPRLRPAAATVAPPARWWRHVGTASLAVLLACLVNPYGTRGLLLPLEILPKIAEAGNPYKENIQEFMSLRSVVAYDGMTPAKRSFYVRNVAFLLMAVPLSFLAPAVWSAWRSAPRAPTPVWPNGCPAAYWLAAIGVGLGMTLVGVLGIPLPGTPAWQVTAGSWVPAGYVVFGLLAATLVARRSLVAASLAATGGVAVAASLVSLQAYLVGPAESAAWSTRGVVMLLAGVLVVVQILSAGGRVVRLILAASFGFLGMQAFRNANLFGLVESFVIASNLDEWAGALLAEGPVASRPERGEPFVPSALSGVVIVGVVITVTWAILGTNDEVCSCQPAGIPAFMFAHDAATRFAGRPGMP